MESFEPKKLALLRIWQILKDYSDYDHPLKQEDIGEILEREYGITIERKAIGRNVSLLKEAGMEIENKGKDGSYLAERDFLDSELKMLIDGILTSKHITAKHSKDLIERICKLSNTYFRSHVKHIVSVNDWSKTENQALFYNIEIIDSAIEKGKQIHYDYNKYGLDKKLKKTSQQYVTPYLMILHNQRYYLMAYSEYWGNMIYHRLDRITNISITKEKGTPIKQVKGFEKGINYKNLSSTMPYMYADNPEDIEFIADECIVDQIIDWFGTEIQLKSVPDTSNVSVRLKASPMAMEHWASQYVNFVEIIKPESLRKKMKESMETGLKKYSL